MFWKYTRFQWKLTLVNRKNWFIATFLLLFFFLYFLYYGQEGPLTMYDKKKMEMQLSYNVFDYLNLERHDIPEVQEVFELYKELQSLLGMQVWHMAGGEDPDQYIEDGLEVNRIRLEIHELGNRGIPDHLVVPVDEILKEEALLHYIKDNDLPLTSESFLTNDYVTNAVSMMSGLLFLLILLIGGNEILVQDGKYRTVLKGMPIPFMQKITSKVVVQSIAIFSFLVIGLFIGIVYLTTNVEDSAFSFPILMYHDESFVAISTSRYLLYLFIGFAFVTVFILLLSVLMNMFFRHAVANILIGLGFFLLPEMVRALGWETTILHPIKFIDIHGVITGDLAVALDNPFMNYWNALLCLSIGCVILIAIIFALNKFSYKRIPKNAPLEKAF